LSLVKQTADKLTGGAIAGYIILGLVVGLALIGAAGIQISRTVRRRRLLKDLQDNPGLGELTYHGEVSGRVSVSKRNSASAASRIDTLRSNKDGLTAREMSRRESMDYDNDPDRPRRQSSMRRQPSMGGDLLSTNV
jgi:hypothetical protein